MTPEIENRLASLAPEREGYGFGFTVAVRPPTGGQNMMGNPGDFSWPGGFGTNFWVDPQDQLAVVFMAQTPGRIRQQYMRQINSLIYGAITQ